MQCEFATTFSDMTALNWSTIMASVFYFVSLFLLYRELNPNQLLNGERPGFLLVLHSTLFGFIENRNLSFKDF